MNRFHVRGVRLAPLVLAVALTACAGDAKDAAATGERARATVVRTQPPAPPPAIHTVSDSVTGEVATIRSLTGGDRACYVDLESGGVAKPGQEAAFDLCERTDLVGRRVRLERRRAWVLAASCEGDPECERRDTVDLIVSAEVRPERGASPPAAAPAHR
jgi:hypothetical protein